MIHKYIYISLLTMGYATCRTQARISNTDRKFSQKSNVVLHSLSPVLSSPSVLFSGPLLLLAYNQYQEIKVTVSVQSNEESHYIPLS